MGSPLRYSPAVASKFDYRAAELIAVTTRPEIPSLFERRPLSQRAPQSVATLLDDVVARSPDREALVDKSGRYTYGQLDAIVGRASSALHGLGVRAGDRVALSAPNSADLVIAFLATQRLGAIWVGINGILAPPEKSFILRDAGVSVFIADMKSAAEIEPCRTDLPELRHLIREDIEWPALLAEASPLPRADVDPFAPAAIAYTSGTTGFPKGAVHSQHNLVLIGAVHRTLGELDENTRHGCVLPLTILNLMVLQPLIAFQCGGAAICIDRVDAVTFADWIARERISHFSGVPTMIYDLLKNPAIVPDRIRTLRRPLVGGAEIPEALCTAYRERFGSEVLVGYGMTEAPTAVTMTDGRRPWQPGICGAPLPHVEVVVVNEEDRELPPGEVGEICVGPRTRGPWAGAYTPMLGYWKRADATRAAFRSGRFHTGDLGMLDGDGWLYFRGRLNDLIIRGGANVYPAEIERVLQEDTRVQGCAVIGRPDERLGERVIAVVELAPGAAATADELRAHCSANLARYKVPEDFVYVRELPRNAMGKVQKREVKERWGRS
jgi:long-chain acyl-CoA synthetase